MIWFLPLTIFEPRRVRFQVAANLVGCVGEAYSHYSVRARSAGQTPLPT